MLAGCRCWHALHTPNIDPRLTGLLCFRHGRLLEGGNATANAIAVQREALATLVAFATSCPANVAAILSCRAACDSLFTTCLPTCGDLGTQVGTPAASAVTCCMHGQSGGLALQGALSWEC